MQRKLNSQEIHMGIRHKRAYAQLFSGLSYRSPPPFEENRARRSQAHPRCTPAEVRDPSFVLPHPPPISPPPPLSPKSCYPPPLP